MADITTKELYDSVNAAIIAVTDRPHSFCTVEGRQFGFQDLKKLCEWREVLRKELIQQGIDPNSPGSTPVAGGQPASRPFCTGFSISGSDF